VLTFVGVSGHWFLAGGTAQSKSQKRRLPESADRWQGRCHALGLQNSRRLDRSAHHAGRDSGCYAEHDLCSGACQDLDELGRVAEGQPRVGEISLLSRSDSVLLNFLVSEHGKSRGCANVAGNFAAS
jgi:hypothetical protein